MRPLYTRSTIERSGDLTVSTVPGPEGFRRRRKRLKRTVAELALTVAFGVVCLVAVTLVILSYLDLW